MRMCVCAVGSSSYWSSDQRGTEYGRGRIPVVPLFQPNVASTLDVLRISGSSYQLDDYVRDLNACVEHDQMKLLFEKISPVFTIITARCYIESSVFCSHRVFVCCVWFVEYTTMISYLVLTDWFCSLWDSNWIFIRRVRKIAKSGN